VLVSLGAASVLVRHLGIAGFGRYVTVVSLVALVGGVSEAGIAVYGIREYGDRADADRRNMLAELLGMRLTLTVLGVGCAAAFGAIAGYSGVLLIGIVVAGAGLLVQVAADVLSIPLQSALRLGRLAVVDLVRRTAALSLIAILAVAGAGLLPFFAVSIAAGTIALALIGWLVRSAFTLRVEFGWRRWRALFADTLPFALAVSVGAIYFYVTIVVMSLIASEHQTGLFATSFRVIQVALAIPALALTAIFPLLSRESGSGSTDLGERMGKVLDVAVVFGVWMSVTMALGASFIVDALAGSHGHGAAAVLRLQGLVLTATFVSASAMFGLLALRRYRAILVANSCALVLDVVLGLALIPALGARGGALADVVTEVVVAVALTFALIRALPRRSINAAALPAVAIAGVLASVLWLVPIGALARALLASGVYFLTLLVLGAVPEDVMRAARRVLPRRRPA
jgi:O-antigen/teichoic acid export membrane protein